MMRVLLAVALLGAAVLAGCEQVVTEDNYERITIGMSKDQVVDILGEGESQDVGGTSISAGGIASSSGSSGSVKTFLWKEGQAQIIVEFKDNAVVNKRKVGME